MINCFNKAREIIKESVDNNLVPGICMALVRKDEHYSCCYGNKSLVPQKEKLTDDTIYDIASLSKVVGTSTMLSKLMEEGLIHFEDKVSDILDDFPYKDITILNLICHTSGYPADDKDYKKCQNKQELWSFIKNLKLTYKTGTAVEYSCFNYIILGRIIEHFKGSLQEYASEVLFKPLQSDNIMYNPKQFNKQDKCAPTEVTQARGIIKGEVHDGKAYINGGQSGNAGLFSDLETLIRFTSMMLNDGTYKSCPVLNKESMDRFKKCYTVGLNQSRTMGGWFFGDKNTSAGELVSDVSLYHTGFTGTSIYIDYKRQLGIVILSNAIHPTRGHKMNDIRKLLHEEILKEFDKEKNPD